MLFSFCGTFISAITFLHKQVIVHCPFIDAKMLFSYEKVMFVVLLFVQKHCFHAKQITCGTFIVSKTLFSDKKVLFAALLLPLICCFFIRKLHLRLALIT